MAQSINTKVDLVISGTSYHGLNSYGKIMIGDKGFEFYNDRNVNDYVIASVMFKGKHIPRYAIQTKENGTYSFASKEPKKVLRAVSRYVAPDHMVRSLSFFGVIKKKLKAKFNK